MYGRGKDIFDVSNSLLFPMRIKSNNESYVSDFLNLFFIIFNLPSSKFRRYAKEAKIILLSYTESSHASPNKSKEDSNSFFISSIESPFEYLAIIIPIFFL